MPDPTSSAPASRPTLLVFTLGPRRERARRRLLPSRLAAWELALHRDCLAAALAAGRANGCRLRVCSPRRLAPAGDVEHRPQAGGGFGERLRRAMAGERPSATSPLVVVGSDAPGLGRRQVAAALAELSRTPGRLVVGPSPDGGFYLLAADRPVDDLLAAVAWRRSDTLASLLAAAHSGGVEVTLLEPLADLDRAADLGRWLAGLRRLPLSWLDALRRLLRRLCRPPLPPVVGRLRPAAARAARGRSPPG